MATRSFSVKEGILYIAVGGVVIFLAVFLGIPEGKPTVVAVVLSGCDPCRNLLVAWREKGIVHEKNETRIVLLAAAPPDEFAPGEFLERYL